jgi:hypothetical protein
MTEYSYSFRENRSNVLMVNIEERGKQTAWRSHKPTIFLNERKWTKIVA